MLSTVDVDWQDPRRIQLHALHGARFDRLPRIFTEFKLDFEGPVTPHRRLSHEVHLAPEASP